jgi:hypothetical protein
MTVTPAEHCKGSLLIQGLLLMQLGFAPTRLSPSAMTALEELLRR